MLMKAKMPLSLFTRHGAKWTRLLSQKSNSIRIKLGISNTKSSSSTQIKDNLSTATTTTNNTNTLPNLSWSSALNQLRPRVASALEATIELQNALGEDDPKWLKRIILLADASSSTNKLLKVVVVGETLSGRSAIVDALVGNPTSSVVPENSCNIYHLSYGPTFEEKSDNSNINVFCPSNWLKCYHISLTIPPPLDQLDDRPGFIQESILSSDVILLVTDSRRCLSSPREQGILRSFTASGKPTTVVIDSNDCNNLEDIAKAQIASGLKKGMQNAFANLKLPQTVTFTRNSTSSSTKSTTVLQSSITKEKNLALKAKSALSTTLLSLSRLKDCEQSIQEMFEAVKKLLTSLSGTVATEQARVHQEFLDKDLGMIERVSSRIVMAIRETLDDIPFWKLFWKGDGINYDIRKQLDQYSLVEAEYRMTHTLGRLAETRDVLITLCSSSLTAASSVLASSTYSSLRTLENDIIRIRDTNVTAMKTTASLDPYLLRNEVALFEVAKGLNAFQDMISTMVGRQMAAQAGLGVLLVVSVYLGVPWAVALPGGVFISAIGMTWMALRWSSMADKFVGEVSGQQKGLRETLLESYNQQIESKVVNPLTDVITFTEETLAKRKDEASNRMQRIKKVEKAVKQLMAIE